jgi:hypothetical protein
MLVEAKLMMAASETRFVYFVFAKIFNGEIWSGTERMERNGEDGTERNGIFSTLFIVKCERMKGNGKERNGTEENGAEGNGVERNGTERNDKEWKEAERNGMEGSGLARNGSSDSIFGDHSWSFLCFIHFHYY